MPPQTAFFPFPAPPLFSSVRSVQTEIIILPLLLLLLLLLHSKIVSISSAPLPQSKALIKFDSIAAAAIGEAMMEIL